MTVVFADICLLHKILVKYTPTPVNGTAVLADYLSLDEHEQHTCYGNGVSRSTLLAETTTATTTAATSMTDN